MASHSCVQEGEVIQPPHLGGSAGGYLSDEVDLEPE